MGVREGGPGRNGPNPATRHPLVRLGASERAA